MGANKRKIVIDANMTISELCLLYLDDRYSKVSLRSYSDYNSKVKIINEYMGNIPIKHFKKKMIDSFKYYLENEKKWCYTDGEKPSNVSVMNEIYQLYEILNQAVKWGILDENYNCILTEEALEFERMNLNEMYGIVMNIKKRKMAENVATRLEMR